MKECKNLKYVPRFSSMQQLKEIDFSGCGDIQDNCFREKYGVSNMMATIELSKDPGFTVCKETEEDKDPGFTVCKETEEDHPYDGYSWREYCQIFANGNPNPRIYYKCTQNGCNAKKHVERGAYDVKILVTTYTGKHGHPKPATRSSSSSGQKNIRSSSSVPARLGRSPFSSSSTTQDMTLFPYPFVLVPQGMMPFSYPSASAPQFPSSLNPGVDMTHLYMSGLSTRPSFPVNQMIGIRKYTTERRREMEGKKEEMRRVWSLESKRRVTLEDLFSEKGFEVFE